ncbi:MAG: TIGR04076 family protein, partial [Firmicutes bacterium]|nr:TIGR04076 family protein [Bacillota bacterium]
MFHPCKITVVKKGFDDELVNAYLENPKRMKICDRVEENQEYLVSDPFEMPDNFCAWAWADIRPSIL